MKGPWVAVVDCDATFLDLMDDLLSDEGFRTLRCPTGANAHERIRAARPSLIILELWLEQPDTGWQIINDFRRDPSTAQTPVLVCATIVPPSAHRPIPPHWSPVATLQKPFELDELIVQIRTLLQPESANGAAELTSEERSPAA